MEEFYNQPPFSKEQLKETWNFCSRTKEDYPLPGWKEGRMEGSKKGYYRKGWDMLRRKKITVLLLPTLSPFLSGVKGTYKNF